MAQHKAPTAVTLAATTEKSGLAQFVDRYWKLGVVLALAVTAVVIFRVSKSETQRQEIAKGWDALLAVTTRDAMGGLTGSVDELGALAERDKQVPAAPWALFLAARSALEEKNFDVAKEMLERLRRDHPNHPLLQQPFAYTEGAGAVSAAAALSQRLESLQAWTGAHVGLFENPAPPPDGPKVRFNTDKGSFVVQLYPNLAPKHVENFLKLVREGFYAGTRFHAIRSGAWIQGGDPNSRDSDVTKWGLGNTEDGVDHEENSLRHFEGYLSMWKATGEPKSSGCQFLVTTSPAHSLDGQNVVFGKVLEGMDTVKKLGDAKLVEGTERPEDPAIIQSTDLL